MNQAMATKLDTVVPSTVLSGFHNSQPPLDTMKSLNFTDKKLYTELTQHPGAVKFRGKRAGFRVRIYALK